MRYAEIVWRCALLVALATGTSGCAFFNGMLNAFKFSSVPPSASAVAPGPSTTPSAAAPVEAPVSLVVQRAFEEAGRALRAGRTAEAERGFRALVQSNPELGGPHANLGLIQRQAGKLPEAAGELEQAVRLSPKQPVFLNQLGITYRQQGQFDKARDAYEKAIGLDPGYAAPHLNLGILHDLYFNDGRRALELYDRYLALSPGGDATVTKWVAELKNRKADTTTASRKEKA